MRPILIALAALSLAAAPVVVQAQEATYSRQTRSMTTMLGYPPPADATRLDDPGGGTWLSHQNGVLVLTAEAPGSVMKYVTFELGEVDAWRLAAPDKKGNVVVEAFVGGTMATLTLDLSKVHTKRTLKVTQVTRS